MFGAGAAGVAGAVFRDTGMNIEHCQHTNGVNKPNIANLLVLRRM